MTPLVIAGAWEPAALPNGEYVAPMKSGALLKTHRGDRQLPNGQSTLRFPVVAQGGKIAGTGQTDNLAWLYDGATWTSRPCFASPRACIFLPDGTLQVVKSSTTEAGSEGFAQISDAGQVVLAKDQRADMTRRLWEYITRDGITIGLGGDGPDGPDPLVAQVRDGSYRLIQRGDCNRADFQKMEDRISLAWYEPKPAPVFAEAHMLWLTVSELEAMPVYQRPVTIPAIGRRLWCGFFEFVPATLPGNCELAVAPEAFVTAGGTRIAAYVAGNPDGDVDSLERNAAAAKVKFGLPVIAYWTRKAQEGRVPRGAEIIGVEAYRLKDESLLAFETRVLASVRRCGTVALICQCYTSNALQTTDLASLVPVYAKVARDCSNVVALLVFSGSGRPTGLQDNPSVRPLWESLAAGIPGPPEIEDDMLNVPRVNVTRFDGLIKRDGWRMEMQDDGNPGLKVQIFTRDGSLHVKLINPAGSNTTGATRKVL